MWSTERLEPDQSLNGLSLRLKHVYGYRGAKSKANLFSIGRLRREGGATAYHHTHPITRTPSHQQLELCNEAIPVLLKAQVKAAMPGFYKR